MEGFATTRTTSGDGRWVYTLFMRPGGYPFVHALDTVRGVAHCIGLPWTASNQAPLMGMRMTLADGGSKLALTLEEREAVARHRHGHVAHHASGDAQLPVDVGRGCGRCRARRARNRRARARPASLRPHTRGGVAAALVACAAWSSSTSS